MPKLKRYIDHFETTANGIPCVVAIVSYYKGSPAVYSGPWAGPEEYPEADWVLLDRRGYVADWLHKKLSDSEIERINEEAVEYMRG